MQPPPHCKGILPPPLVVNFAANVKTGSAPPSVVNFAANVKTGSAKAYTFPAVVTASAAINQPRSRRPYRAVVAIAVAIAVALWLLKSRATSLPAYSHWRTAIE